MSLIVALSLVGALVEGQGAQASASVSGRVLEQGSGAPIAGAQVVLTPQRSGRPVPPFIDPSRTVSTDGDGRYEFDNLEGGRYRLRVQKVGFAPVRGPEPPELHVAPGERGAGPTLTLQKGGVIAGRVVDEAGEPLAGVHVAALQQPPEGSVSARAGSLITAGSGAPTNDLGEFRLFSLAPGEYFVHAISGTAFGRPTKTPGRALLATYFPGTPDQASAHAVTVAAGQTTGEIVIAMMSAPAFRVSGIVVDEARRPVAHAMVRLMVEDVRAGPSFMTGRLRPERTDESGRFVINEVTNGTYILIAAAPLVIARPAARTSSGVVAVTRSTWAAGLSAGSGGGTEGGVLMETSADGTTFQYRDDTGTRVSITVNQANVTGLEVTVRLPSPK